MIYIFTKKDCMFLITVYSWTFLWLGGWESQTVEEHSLETSGVDLDRRRDGLRTAEHTRVHWLWLGRVPDLVLKIIGTHVCKTFVRPVQPVTHKIVFVGATQWQCQHTRLSWLLLFLLLFLRWIQPIRKLLVPNNIFHYMHLKQFITLGNWFKNLMDDIIVIYSLCVCSWWELTYPAWMQWKGIPVHRLTMPSKSNTRQSRSINSWWQLRITGCSSSMQKMGEFWPK